MEKVISILLHGNCHLQHLKVSYIDIISKYNIHRLSQVFGLYNPLRILCNGIGVENIFQDTDSILVCYTASIMKMSLIMSKGY